MSRLVLLLLLGVARMARAFPCGDVNGDSVVNVGDALIIAQFDVATRPCGGSFSHPELCDANTDNACNIGDALRCAQCDVGLNNCLFTCGSGNPCTTSTTTLLGTTTTVTTMSTTTTTTLDGTCDAPVMIPAQGGTFSGATSGTSLQTGACGTTSNSPERVFQWTPAVSGTATANTCGNQTTFDTVLYVRGTPCLSGTSVACNDDACANASSPSAASQVSFPVTASQTYFLVVDGASGGQQGNFRLTVTPPTTSTTTVVTTTTTTTTAGDRTVPSVPSGIGVAVDSCTQITSTWNASTDTGGSGLKGYRLYRLGLFDHLILAPTTTFADTGLAGGRQYYYSVTAVDNAGNESLHGSTVYGTTPACIPPLGPFRWNKAITGPGNNTFVTAQSMAVDSSGNVVVAGQFVGTIDVGGASLTSSSNQGDMFVVKYNAAGTHVWSFRVGGTSVQPNGIAVDASGNVVVTGYVVGTMSFGGAPLTTSQAGQGFLVKYAAADGAHVWSKLIGAPGVTVANKLAIDSGGNLVVTGYFQNTADFGGGTRTSAGFADGFIAKYNASGVYQWDKSFGGSDFENGISVAVDSSDNVLATGYLYSSVNFGGGTITSAGGRDVYLAKLSPSGTHIWSKGYGDAPDQYVSAVTADSAGNVLLAGSFFGTMDFGSGVVLTNAGGGDIYVAKLSPTGMATWAKQFGTGDVHGDNATAVAADASGNVILTGAVFEGVDFGAGPLNGNYDYDVFVAKYNSSGGHIWSGRYGGQFDDRGYAVAADPNGNIVAAGNFTMSLNFGGGAITGQNNLSSGFVVQFGP